MMKIGTTNNFSLKEYKKHYSYKSLWLKNIIDLGLVESTKSSTIFLLFILPQMINRILRYLFSKFIHWVHVVAAQKPKVQRASGLFIFYSTWKTLKVIVVFDLR